ncbi:MAG TPA: DNA repair protein RecN [Vicinamibacterales bacterium]|nr:DNA repair protein RecN [Vicinamibacterales bacterium]
MLRFLGVRNLSVIDHLEVEFEPGLNVLSGETGAGKSVVVEAIGLLTGGRASADLIRTGESQASVQAIFETSAGREVIVRREVSSQGRSRAFIDDALATTGALRDFGAEHLELHGQHEHQALVDPSEHVELLDAHAGHGALREQVAARYAEWRAVVVALERTELSDREKRARIDMASFQLQEIDKVSPVAGEDERLASERTVLANADRLSRLSAEAYAALYEGEAAVLSGFAAVYKRVAELAALDGRFAQYAEQRDDLKARLEDLAYFLRHYASEFDASPDRLQAVEDRLATLERLNRRYGPSLSDVIARREALRVELDELGASEERVAELTAHEREARDAFSRASAEIGRARQAAGRALASSLEKDLKELAMPACRVDVRVAPAPEDRWSAAGTDDVEFFLSPNPGEELRPLARIASGGELSRIMLALRVASLRSGGPQTLIFDEVDAGIGGAAADAVGARLQALGARHQVLCVTHLAQIAARAACHLQISKQVRAGRTSTTVTRLDDAARVAELGRMIAGAEVSTQVLASAREMLASRRGENSAKGENESSRQAKAKGRRGGR